MQSDPKRDGKTNSKTTADETEFIEVNNSAGAKQVSKEV
jgi:hypothetical protein